MSNRVLRVFLSSTATDMTACREKVRDTVLQLKQLPIGMETFTALPTTPAADCQREAADADVVIVLVAYRYGYVPSVELGGDGQRSITWLEVVAAKNAGKPVYAFLIDPNATWNQPKDTDRLNTEPAEKHAEILAAIRSLNEFKADLQARCTFSTFTDAGDLAAKVATTLSAHVMRVDPSAARPAKVWQPRVCYPLQPAPHFQGRERLRAELAEWARSRVSPDRVVSLVAVGGTGKTALAERIVAEFIDQSGKRAVSGDATLTRSVSEGAGDDATDKSASFTLRVSVPTPAAGLLVWSFYENPRTEEFLRTACEYFTGETPTSAGGLLERLQVALAGDEPHLLVLDGLERVQAEGMTGRPRGELEDPQLRRLVRWLAAGQGTRTRALVTSRFPLVDLDDWKHAGHREERLEDLEPAAARAVLRGWGVKGDDATLDGLAAPLGYHALSVAVLGSYLGKLWGGDPTKAPTFDRGELAIADQKASLLTRILSYLRPLWGGGQTTTETSDRADLVGADPKAAKLTRILMHYADKLPAAERDLLARLSAFPRGVMFEFLGFLIDAGGTVAGALVGCSEVRLLSLLDRLRELGVIFRYETPQGATFSAHPFLRGHFRNLLGATKPEEVHEVIRQKLATRLRVSGRPITATTIFSPVQFATERTMLDRFEALVEHTRLAGHTAEAFELYQSFFGGFPHLGWVVGDYARGVQILSGFSPDGRPNTAVADLPDWAREQLFNDWGLFAENLGDLPTAREAFALFEYLSLSRGNTRSLAVVLVNQTELELLAGRFAIARNSAESLKSIHRQGAYAKKEYSQTCLASVLGRLGEVEDSRRHFAKGRELAGTPHLYSFSGIWEAEFRIATGDRAGARTQTLANREFCESNEWTSQRAFCDVLLGQLDLPDDPSGSREYLNSARSYASGSGNVKVQIPCYHLAAEIARAERAYDLARSEAEAGIHLADTCDFGHYSIELRLALARAQLDAGDPKAALQRAREALDRSVHRECKYAWGEADALHLCGAAHSRLGELDLARTRLTAAVAKREQLTHPGLAETRAELAHLRG